MRDLRDKAGRVPSLPAWRARVSRGEIRDGIQSGWWSVSRVVSATRSSGRHRWVLELECGHYVTVFGVQIPKRKNEPCYTCMTQRSAERDTARRSR